MAKAKSPKDIIENIVQTTLEEVMHKSMIPYAEYVILDRALPRVEDGLKPVQRRILYTMHELGLIPDKPHRKCARIVGDCLGKYHPHGDNSVYDSLVRMAQDFIMNACLVDGHGNFGSIDGDSPAAMRYTEARMTGLAGEMLADLNKNTVQFVLNFDDELLEPDILPSKFPNLLVNGSSGIAVGLATNIPPHNLRETIDATIAMIKNPDITIEELLSIIKGPDFPTGGSIIDTEEIRNAYLTGKGKIKIRAKTHIEKSISNRKLIVIDEIPYQVSKANMLEKIQTICVSKKHIADMIFNVRDESDRNGMRAIIELKKDVDPNIALSFLFKYSDLETTFAINIVAIADGKPQQLNLFQVLKFYIQHQKNVVLNRTKFDLEKSKIRAHILEGLIIALNNIDEVIRIIKGSKTPKIANDNLCINLNITKEQAQAILEMRLQRLTNLEINAIKEEHSKLVKLIIKLESIIASNKKLSQVIITELTEISNLYSVQRKTDITIDKMPDIPSIIEQVKIENNTIIFTGEYKIQRYNNFDSKDFIIDKDVDYSDIIISRIDTDTSHKLLIFTNLGNCYYIDMENIPLISKKSDRGLMLNALISGYTSKEKAIFFLPVKGESLKNYELIFITTQGFVKKSNFSEYTINRSKFTALKLNAGDELFRVFINNNLDLILISKNANSIRFSVEGVNSTGRLTRGVNAMTLSQEDAIIFSEQIENNQNILLFTNKGYAKRIPTIDFELQKRAGKGVKCFSFLKNATNGSFLVNAFSIKNDSALLIQQKKSSNSLIKASDIPLQKKDARGMPCVVSVLDDNVEKVLCLEENYFDQ